MTGSRDKFDDDSDLDQLAHDLDLDMDAPIGATFAAALRGQADESSIFKEPEPEFGLYDDDFLTPPPPPAAAAAERTPPVPPAPADDHPAEVEYAEFESLEDEFSDEDEDFDPPPPMPDSMTQQPMARSGPSSLHCRPPGSMLSSVEPSQALPCL